MKILHKITWIALVFIGISSLYAQVTPRVTAPVLNDVWAGQQLIRWTMPSGIQLLKLEYSINNGAKWNLITDTAKSSANQYLWNVPGANSAACLVRVSNKADSNVFAVSKLFKIIPNPGVKDYTIPVTVSYTENPASIRLQWTKDTNITQYSIDRKKRNDSFWEFITDELNSNSTEFIDKNVNVGEIYEYRITKSNKLYIGYQYLQCGIKSSLRDYNGIIMMIVENKIADSLKPEINQLKTDLIKDGWGVLIKKVSDKESVKNVKKMILEANSATPLTTLFILGHVPVPYSGEIAPDGHPDHIGAWPADVYYADIDESEWTDKTVNNNKASRTANKNVPNDGKFDQGTLPTSTEFQIGRVDLSNMPLFKETEVELTRKYLAKLHNYKIGNVVLKKQGLIDDNFGMYGSVGGGFATTAWGGFYSNVGIANTSSNKYFTKLVDDNYLFSYGCGGGSYTSCSGVGTTNDFLDKKVNSIFTFLFGSYFGDWDVDNSFLRAPLANSGSCLTSAWSGRPYWHFHHMAMGENIGYSAFVTQNNQVDGDMYNPGTGAPGVHVALLGDPSLRSAYNTLITNVKTTDIDGEVRISWDSHVDKNIIGYHVFVAKSIDDKFRRINSELITELSFLDASVNNGNNVYMVRPVWLETTPTGSYYNMGLGTIDSISVIVPAISQSPSLYFPKKDTTNFATSAYLKFSKISLADRYYIEISSNENFVNPEVKAIQSDTVFTFKNLKSQSKYYWRVQGINGAGNGPWSEVWNFTTGYVSEVAATRKLPKVMKLR